MPIMGRGGRFVMGDAGLAHERFRLVIGMDAGENHAIRTRAVIERELEQLLALFHRFAGFDLHRAEIALGEGVKNRPDPQTKAQSEHWKNQFFLPQREQSEYASAGAETSLEPLLVSVQRLSLLGAFFVGSFILDQAGVNTIKFSIFQLSPILHIFALL